MKTLLTGFVSAGTIVIAILFFFEHLPQARQIKQDHPTIVIVAGIVLVFVTWHALHTILLIIAAFLAPLPLCFLHAIFRSSENLIDSSMTGDYFVSTPVGQIMQILGIDPKATIHEWANCCAVSMAFSESCGWMQHASNHVYAKLMIW